MQMIGHFKMLFSLLASPHHSVQVHRCSVNLSVVDMLPLEDRPGLTLSSRSHQHVENHHHLQDSALAVISGTTGNAECVADIAGSLCLGRFSPIVTI